MGSRITRNEPPSPNGAPLYAPSGGAQYSVAAPPCRKEQVEVAQAS